MNKKVWMVLGAVLLAGLAAVPLVHAELNGAHQGMAMHGGHDGYGMMGMGPFGKLRRLKSQLDLTDSQVDQLHAIAKDVRQQNAPLRTQIHGNMQNVARILIEDPSNVAKAQQLLDQQSATEQQLRGNILNGVSKALGILTAEQRTKLRQILDEKAGHA
jgi:protein CpxP